MLQLVATIRWRRLSYKCEFKPWFFQGRRVCEMYLIPLLSLKLFAGIEHRQCFYPASSIAMWWLESSYPTNEKLVELARTDVELEWMVFQRVLTRSCPGSVDWPTEFTRWWTVTDSSPCPKLFRPVSSKVAEAALCSLLSAAARSKRRVERLAMDSVNNSHRLCL
jgi:hypothetical protein